MGGNYGMSPSMPIEGLGAENYEYKADGKDLVRELLA